VGKNLGPKKLIKRPERNVGPEGGEQRGSQP